jgi:transposase
MTVTLLGIDLAKHVFQLDGIDANGRRIISRALPRAKLVDCVVRLAPQVVAFEAGSGAHHWARRFEALGLTVKMISPQYVKPFRKGASKDDAADAAAIVEAALRPSMPMVAVKKVWQQDLQALHRIRQDLVERRTALCNQYRGHLVEFGVAPAQSIAKLVEATRQVLFDGDESAVPPMLRRWLGRFLDQLVAFEEDIDLVTADIERFAKQSEVCQRLVKIPGIGVLTATAFYAAVGDEVFLKNGRQTAAWLGLTPRRVGSGGKTRDLGISKQGDTYLRTLLIHGGRALVSAAKRSPGKASHWVRGLAANKPANVAAVAIANRNARIAWRLVAKAEAYDPRRVAAA